MLLNRQRRPPIRRLDQVLYRDLIASDQFQCVFECCFTVLLCCKMARPVTPYALCLVPASATTQRSSAAFVELPGLAEP